MTQVQFSESDLLVFEYDAAGNVLSITTQGVTISAYSSITGEEGTFLALSDIPINWIIGRAPDYDGDGINDIVDEDDDNDGISDAWELQFGFNPFFADDAKQDSDQDGFTNREEFEAGSDPKDDQSTPDTAKPFQIVSVEGCDEIELNSIASCRVRYNTSDDSTLSSGVQFRLHFNANELDFSGTANPYADGLVAIDSGPISDQQDYDSNPDTTHYLSASWTRADWPNVALPITLFDVQLGFVPTAVNGDSSTIGFSSLGVDEAYQFSWQPTTITARNSCNLDVDDDGSVGPLSDGLLILRYMFNFTGNTLVADMFSAGSQRNTAEDVEAYLNGCAAMLDADDSGDVKPLSDGLLILRHMFGLRAEALVGDALSPSSRRNTAMQISDYLEAFYP